MDGSGPVRAILVPLSKAPNISGTCINHPWTDLWPPRSTQKPIQIGSRRGKTCVSCRGRDLLHPTYVCVCLHACALHFCTTATANSDDGKMSSLHFAKSKLCNIRTRRLHSDESALDKSEMWAKNAVKEMLKYSGSESNEIFSVARYVDGSNLSSCANVQR